jgi:hypothetical protein
VSPRTDHFDCYKVRPSRGIGAVARFRPIRFVRVADQFGSRYVNVIKPEALCMPADKNGEDPDAPAHATALLCYRTQPVPPRFTEVAPIFTANQFGHHIVRAIKTEELCVPSVVDGTPITTTTTTITPASTTVTTSSVTTSTQPTATTSTTSSTAPPTLGTIGTTSSTSTTVPDE